MSSADQLHGADIAKVLSSQGPVVKCVLLKAPKDYGEKKPHAVENGKNEKPVLTDLLEELSIDTTPSKSMVATTLGGPFTFLGQYEDEGIVLMVRNLPSQDPLDQDELKEKRLSELRNLCQEREISMEGMLEKSDLIGALMKDSANLPSVNPHALQPPLHKAVVRGDILVLKVAETKEELDGEENEDGKEEGKDQAIEVPDNDEFFLDYTKDELTKFLSRTDIPEHEIEQPGSDDEEFQEGDDSAEAEEGGFVLGEDEELDDEDKSAMFNLVMNEVLRQYREEHGRGPNTQELLELRANIAKELNVEVAKVDAEGADWDKKAKGDSTAAYEKKIGFHKEDKVLEFHPDPAEHDHHDYEEGDEDENDANDAPANEPAEEEADDGEQPPRKKLKTSPADIGESSAVEEEPAGMTTDQEKNPSEKKEVKKTASGDGADDKQ